MIIKEIYELNSKAVNLLDDAVFYVSLDKNILSWNKAAEKLYGYNDREIIGRPLKILFHPEAGLIDLEKCKNINTIHITKGNKNKYVNLSVKFAEESYFVIIKDRTEHVLVNAEMEKSRINHYNNLYELFHDNLCQLLTGLSFKQKYLESKIEPYINTSQELKLHINDINSVLDSSLNHCRIFEKKLLMLSVDSENIEELINQYMGIIQEQYNVSCSVNFSIKKTNILIINYIYFLLQKIVLFAVEHCKAERINIALSNSEIEAITRFEFDGIKTLDVNDEYLKTVKHWLSMIGGNIEISKRNCSLNIIECSIICIN